MLGYLWLSLKRAFRSAYFLVMLAFLAVAAYFAPAIGADEGLKPAALCNCDSSEISSRIAEYLIENGYELCSDEEMLLDGIESGTYDCGAVIPNGFGDLVASGNADGAISFVVTPVSYAPDIYKNHIAAAVYKECAPYITADALKDTVITFDDVYEKYSGMTEDGALFSFKEQLADGDVAYEQEREKTYILATASFMILALMLYSASDVFASDVMTLAPRIGSWKAVLLAVMPDISVRALAVVAAYAVSAFVRQLICGDDISVTLLPAVCVYVILSCVFGIFAVTVLADRTRISACVFYLFVLSLVLCPIYFDAALVLPVMAKIRMFMPTYWLWMLDEADSVGLAFLASIALYLLALLFMSARFGNYKARERSK